MNKQQYKKFRIVFDIIYLLTVIIGTLVSISVVIGFEPLSQYAVVGFLALAVYLLVLQISGEIVIMLHKTSNNARVPIFYSRIAGNFISLVMALCSLVLSFLIAIVTSLTIDDVIVFVLPYALTTILHIAPVHRHGVNSPSFAGLYDKMMEEY